MISYHHIGGRNGTYPLPLKKGILLQDFHLVLYDADSNCINQIEKANHGDWGQVNVFPYCIGGENKEAIFHLNYHPTTNSLYPFNSEYTEYTYVNNPNYGEYKLGDACKTLNTISLNLVTLSEALEKSNIDSLDFLSLDVQGAEYDILYGAKRLLKSKCLGIELEAEFIKLYNGQKTFSDINTLLESLDFELIELECFSRCAPISMPIGYRGQEQILSAEAIYIKKLDSLVALGNIEQIWKAALFALIYRKIGLCIKYLKCATQMDSDNRNNSNRPTYIKMLNEIWSLYESDQHFIFPSIAELFSHKAFQSYYQSGENHLDKINENLENKVEILSNYTQELQTKNPSDLEGLLQKYDLNYVSEIVKNNREAETNIFLELENNLKSRSVM